MNYYIGTDIGTSGTKTVLFDAVGRVVAESSYEYPLYQPKKQWAEQNAEDYYKATIATIANVVKESGVDSNNILGIGLSGQMHGLVMLDSFNNVLRPCIIWCDQRTEQECQQITDMVGYNKLLDITCNPALTGFTASKILWVKNNEPQVFSQCAKILLPKDYVRFRLTGEYATEVSDASGMQLLNVKERKWSKEMCDALGISTDMLGKVYESCEPTGKITADVANATGLKQGTIVAGGAGDQAGAGVGSGIVKSGLVSCTIGSSGVVFAHTNQPLFDKLGRLHTFCHAVPNAWHVMGVTQGAGLSLKWLKDSFYFMQKDPYSVINKDILEVAPLSEGLLYLPYLMGERCPHLDSFAKGVFCGLTARHGLKHMARAVMEGVSYSLLDCLSLIAALGIEPQTVRLGGGGAKSLVWRQMLSDVFGINTFTPFSQEAGCVGVAILASVASGEYASVEIACDAMVGKEGETNSPDLQMHNKYQLGYTAYKNLYNSLKDNFKEIQSL